MSNKTLALVAVAGLAIAGYASAASSGLLPQGIDMGMGMQKRCERAASPEGEAAEKCQARGMHAQRGGHGQGFAPPFRVANGTLDGKWVSFQVDGAQDSLLAYTSKGPLADVVVFDRVTVSPGSDEDGMRHRGALWVGHEGSVVAAAFNAPNAFLALKNLGAETATVTFDLGDALAAEAKDRGILLTHDGHRAGLMPRGNATLSLADGVVTATLGHGDAVVFAIEGFPRILEHEVKVLRHIARAWNAGQGDREAPPAEGEDELAALPIEA